MNKIDLEQMPVSRGGLEVFIEQAKKERRLAMNRVNRFDALIEEAAKRIKQCITKSSSF